MPDKEKDIVDRLRAWLTPVNWPRDSSTELIEAAADEIERLRAEYDRAHEEGWKAAKLAMMKEAEDRRLVRDDCLVEQLDKPN